MLIVVDLTSGFPIEDPPAFIPWRITQAELRMRLGNNLRMPARGQYTISCVTLGGLRHELGFRFEPRDSDYLAELEFFRGAYMDPAASFREFQRYFERAFGAARHARSGTCGFFSYEWVVPGARILHHVIDQFGPKEHTRIRRA